jgi:LL-diaminopimelate aminotransferase
MLKPANRMQGMSSAIFTQVDDMRKKAAAAGKDVITLSLGSPDVAPAPHVMEALRRGVSDPKNYGYALSKGTPEFLQAVADWYRTKFGVALEPATEVHSLIGSQDGLAHISLCYVNPGDVVLVPDPGYPIYTAGPLSADAELYLMPLTPENDYLPDLDAIPESVYRRAKMMIINYPNNPLAAIATTGFFARVIELARKYEFLVCHDFAYSDLCFDGYRPPSFLSLPGAKDIGVEFHTMSKSFCMAGCRVGFMVGNAQAVELLGRVKSNFDYGIFLPIQQAAVAALTGPQDCVTAMAAEYQRRRDIIVDGFNAFGWKVPRPKASMYVWAPVPTKQNSFDFAASLIENAGVAVVPGVGFGPHGEGYVRIALVQPQERLRQAVDRIRKWLG